MSAWGDARDKIALEAMQCLLRHPSVLARDPVSTVDAVAEVAYRQADAMLRRRDDPVQEGSDG